MESMSFWSELAAGLGVGEAKLAVLVGGGGGMAVLIFIMFITRFLFMCRPQEMLIFAGRKHRRADGAEVGYRVVFGGRAWRMPIIETVDRMDMRRCPSTSRCRGPTRGSASR